MPCASFRGLSFLNRRCRELTEFNLRKLTRTCQNKVQPAGLPPTLLGDYHSSIHSTVWRQRWKCRTTLSSSPRKGEFRMVTVTWKWQPKWMPWLAPNLASSVSNRFRLSSKARLFSFVSRDPQSIAGRCHRRPALAGTIWYHNLVLERRGQHQGLEKQPRTSAGAEEGQK